jgi:hypothetical protein
MIMALAFAALLAGPPQACALERADYVLRGSDGVTARFDTRAPTPDWPTDVTFSIHSAKTGATITFLPYSGNGQGVTGHLASVQDPAAPPGPDTVQGRPTGDLDYLAADATYRFDQGFIARAGRPAPAHLFLPGLQAALWYRRDDAQREGVPMAFFDLAGCRD